MKSFRRESWFRIPTRRALVNMTPLAGAALAESGISAGPLRPVTATPGTRWRPALRPPAWAPILHR